MSYTRQFIGNEPTLWAEMQTICDWLHANGIDYRNIPLDATVTIDRRNMTIESHVRGPGGGILLNADWNGALRKRITVPIQRRPPVLASLGPARRTRRAP